jgi:glycosyl transferase family 87
MFEGVFRTQTAGLRRASRLGPSERSRRRANLATAAAIGFGLAVFGVALHGYALWDFEVFRRAGQHLLTGQRLYPTQTELDQNTASYFIYPPFVAALFVPFALLPLVLGGALYLLLALGATVATIRILGVNDPKCYLALLFWIPILQSVELGTIEPFLGLALAVAWVHRRSRFTMPLALACAVAAKLFLWPLIFWLLATRRWRAALTGTFATAALILVPWALLGFRDLLWYPQALTLLLKHERAWGYQSRDVLGGVGLGPAAIVLQLLAVVAVFWLAARQDGDRRSFSAAILCALVLSPLVWVHYYSLLIVPIALVRPRRSWLWIVPILDIWPPGNNPNVPLLTLAIVLVLAGVGVATCTLEADLQAEPL